jgi:hypothetical protein
MVAAMAPPVVTPRCAHTTLARVMETVLATRLANADPMRRTRGRTTAPMRAIVVSTLTAEAVAIARRVSMGAMPRTPVVKATSVIRRRMLAWTTATVERAALATTTPPTSAGVAQSAPVSRCPDAGGAPAGTVLHSWREPDHLPADPAAPLSHGRVFRTHSEARVAARGRQGQRARGRGSGVPRRTPAVPEGTER